MCATSALGVAIVLFVGLLTTSTKDTVQLTFCRVARPAQISRGVITNESPSQGPMMGKLKIKAVFLASPTKVGLGRPRVPNSGADPTKACHSKLSIHMVLSLSRWWKCSNQA